MVGTVVVVVVDVVIGVVVSVVVVAIETCDVIRRWFGIVIPDPCLQLPGLICPIRIPLKLRQQSNETLVSL